MTAWPSVHLDVPLRDLPVRLKAAVAGTGIDGRRTLVYVQFARPRSGRIRMGLCDTATRTPMPPQIIVSVSADLTLREVLLAHVDVDAFAAAVLPGLRWPFVRLSLVTAALTPGSRQVQTNTQIQPMARDEHGRDLLPSQVHPRLPRPAAVEGSAVTAGDRVTAVHDAYARLRDDIGYRIENSALFDAAHPSTEAFEIALLTFDPGSPDAERAARVVETAFATARRSAEELGYDHLPSTARATARRARLAAATALAPGSEAERAAARQKVTQLLGSLALYYLPAVDADAPQLVVRRRQIEPGR